MDDLSDVFTEGVEDGDVLIYVDGPNIWVPAPLPAGNGGAELDGMFTEQTPAPEHYFYAQGGVKAGFGAALFDSGRVTPLIFDTTTDITKLAVTVTSNPPTTFGGNEDGIYVWLFIYEADITGMPATRVASSDRFQIVPPDAASPPVGAFDDPGGLLEYTLDTPVTLTANTRYWIGLLAVNVQDPFLGGQPPSFAGLEKVRLGPTLDGGSTGIFEMSFPFSDHPSSLEVGFAIDQEAFDYSDNPVPATIDPMFVFLAGTAPVVAALVAPAE
jgi:hypothetical protein